MFGPHRSLRAGNYKVEIFDEQGKREPGHLNFDFVANGGKDCYWQGGLQVSAHESSNGDPLVQFEVHIEREISDFEIRCIVDSACLSLSRVVISRAN
jgi:hypothetical protein